jgi:hypothetical protein
MSRFSKLLVAVLAIIAIAGCEGQEDVLPGLFKVRFLHAAPDAPRVFVRFQGPFGGLTTSPINYKQGPDGVGVRLGESELAIETIRPGGNKIEFVLANFATEEDTNYEVMLIGKIADDSLDTLIFSNPQSQVSAGSFRMQYVHVAPDSEDVIVYVTTPDLDLDGAPSQGTLAYKGFLAPFENPAGVYQIRVALASDPLTPIFDSGALDFTAGGDLLLTVVTNTATGAAPISLVVQQQGSDASDLLDIDTPADLRFVNTAPDAPALDVIIDDETTPSFADVSFTQFTDYLDPGLAPATYNVKVVDSPAPGMVEAINADPDLKFGVAHTILATGLYANIPLSGVLLADNNRRIATEAKLRIVHASNLTGTVDVYLPEPGGAVDTSSLALINLRFQTTAGYSSFAEGSYEVTVTDVDEPTNVVIDATPISVVNGGIYTLVMVDTAGGIAPAAWILMDDLAP